MKYVTAHFAMWNISIFMFGCFLGTVLGLNEQFLNLVRHNLSFCGN